MAIESENKKLNKRVTKKSPHAGHRQRVIKKYIEHGLDSFDEHEVLELLLFFSVPRRDTNPLAHSLIDEFGSLQNVFNASPEELLLVDGIGNNSATLISLFRAVRQYQNTQLYDKSIKLDEAHKIGMFCVKYFSEHLNESAIMLAMDSRYRLLKVSVISTGTINESAFYPSKIMKTALNLRASMVVIAHNHPGGKLQPSPSDIMLTKELYDLLKGVRIELLDHIICNEHYFTSLSERGFFDNF